MLLLPLSDALCALGDDMARFVADTPRSQPLGLRPSAVALACQRARLLCMFAHCGRLCVERSARNFTALWSWVADAATHVETGGGAAAPAAAAALAASAALVAAAAGVEDPARVPIPTAARSYRLNEILRDLSRIEQLELWLRDGPSVIIPDTPPNASSAQQWERVKVSGGAFDGGDEGFDAVDDECCSAAAVEPPAGGEQPLETLLAGRMRDALAAHAARGGGCNTTALDASLPLASVAKSAFDAFRDLFSIIPTATSSRVGNAPSAAATNTSADSQAERFSVYDSICIQSPAAASAAADGAAESTARTLRGGCSSLGDRVAARASGAGGGGDASIGGGTGGISQYRLRSLLQQLTPPSSTTSAAAAAPSSFSARHVSPSPRNWPTLQRASELTLHAFRFALPHAVVLLCVPSSNALGTAAPRCDGGGDSCGGDAVYAQLLLLSEAHERDAAEDGDGSYAIRAVKFIAGERLLVARDYFVGAQRRRCELATFSLALSHTLLQEDDEGHCAVHRFPSFAVLSAALSQCQRSLADATADDATLRTAWAAVASAASLAEPRAPLDCRHLPLQLGAVRELAVSVERGLAAVTLGRHVLTFILENDDDEGDEDGDVAVSDEAGGDGAAADGGGGGGAGDDDAALAGDDDGGDVVGNDADEGQ